MAHNFAHDVEELGPLDAFIKQKNEEKEAQEKARGTRTDITTPIQGDKSVVEAVIPGDPEFSREPRQQLADLFAFFIGQGAQNAGLPANVLSQIFSGQFGGLGAGVSPGQSSNTTQTGTSTTSGDGGTEVIRPPPLENANGLSPLADIPGLGGFLEQNQTGPEPGTAALIGASAAPAIINQLGSLLGGGSDQPRQLTGGQGGLQPAFPDVNQQQLNLFLQFLQAISAQGPATALGPEPFSTEIAGDINPQTGQAPPPALPAGQPLAPQIAPAVEPAPVVAPPPAGLSAAVPATVGVGNQQPGSVVSQVPGGPPPPGSLGVTGTEDPTITNPGEAGLNTAVDPNDPLQNFLNQIGGGQFGEFLKQFSLPTFQGPFSTPSTGLQRQALGAAGEFLDADPAGSQAQSEQALQELLAGTPFNNTAEFDALENVNKRRLGEESAQLNELFGTLGGRFGTDIAKGQSDLRARALDNEALQRATIGRESFENSQNRRLGALPEARQAATSRLGNITDLFRLGEADRQIGDQGIQRQLAEFARTQGAIFPLLMQFLTAGVGEDTAALKPA